MIGVGWVVIDTLPSGGGHGSWNLPPEPLPAITAYGMAGYPAQGLPVSQFDKPLPALPPLPAKWPERIPEGTIGSWDYEYPWRQDSYHNIVEAESEANALRARVEELHAALVEERERHEEARRNRADTIIGAQYAVETIQAERDEARKSLVDAIKARDRAEGVRGAAFEVLTRAQDGRDRLKVERDKALALVKRLRNAIVASGQGGWLGALHDEANAMLAQFPQAEPAAKPETCSNCGAPTQWLDAARVHFHADSGGGQANAACGRAKKETPDA